MTISIQYDPPAGVTLRPPNYRAGTSVSLRCHAVGTSGFVAYEWTSTCGSDCLYGDFGSTDYLPFDSTCGSGCFVNGSSQTVGRDRLMTYDAGQHTCVVTDDSGTGLATIKMNIIG